MAFPVTINGNTYTSADFEGYAYLVNFPAIIADIATEADTVANNAAIAQNAGGLNYKFNTATSDADPTSGKLAVNNATLSSVTELYISETTDASQDASGFLAYWDDSTSTTKGYVRIVKQSDLTVFLVLEITGSITDNGGWDKFSVNYVSHSGSFSNNDELTVSFTPSGAKGDTGSGVGDGDYGDITVSGSGTVYSIDAGVVDTTELADNAVETAKIADGAVTLAKVADSAYQQPFVTLDAAQTFAAADANVMQVLTGSTNRIWTIPADSAVSYTAGVEIPVFNHGTAELTLTADTGVDVNGVTAGSITLTANQGGVLKNMAADDWIYMGVGQEDWA